MMAIRIVRLMKKKRTKPSPQRKIVITVSEVAEALSLTPNTVRKAIKRGDIGAMVVNGRYRIPVKELNCFITRNMHAREAFVSDFSECFSNISLSPPLKPL